MACIEVKTLLADREHLENRPAALAHEFAFPGFDAPRSYEKIVCQRGKQERRKKQDVGYVEHCHGHRDPSAAGKRHHDEQSEEPQSEWS